MAFLFVVENSIAKPNVETLLISPFKEIWERDLSEDKNIALKEFSFIEFMSSKKKTNPYGGFDDTMRYDRLLKEMPEGWEMDSLVELALVKIKDFQEEASPTYQYYMSAKTAAEKMRGFFNTFSFSDINERTGAPLYKPRDITSALNDTDRVLQNLNTMKEKVEQELFEQTKTRGNKEINPFEK